MNYRINTKVVFVVLVLMLLVGGFFIYTLISAPVEYVIEDTPQQAQQEKQIERMLIAKHQYREGTHALAGKAQVPTPCHRLIAEPYILETASSATSSPETRTVEVRFSTLLEGEACPNEPFDAPFFVTFDAPEQVEITATWNGAPVRLNLIPVGPDEELRNEVYIKG